MTDHGELMRWGEAIKHARKMLGISQRALAKISGVSSPTLSQLESGCFEPSLSTLRKLALVFGWNQRKVGKLVMSSDGDKHEQ